MVSIVVEPTRWWTYVEAVVRGAQQKDVAHRVGIDPSHISRWSRGDIPTAPFAVEFARAYGLNVLKALVEAEIITQDEADLHEVRVGIGDFSTVELVEELLLRVRSGGNL